MTYLRCAAGSSSRSPRGCPTPAGWQRQPLQRSQRAIAGISRGTTDGQPKKSRRRDEWRSATHRCTLPRVHNLLHDGRRSRDPSQSSTGSYNLRERVYADDTAVDVKREEGGNDGAIRSVRSDLQEAVFRQFVVLAWPTAPRTRVILDNEQVVVAADVVNLSLPLDRDGHTGRVRACPRLSRVRNGLSSAGLRDEYQELRLSTARFVPRRHDLVERVGRDALLVHLDTDTVESEGSRWAEQTRVRCRQCRLFAKSRLAHQTPRPRCGLLDPAALASHRQHHRCCPQCSTPPSSRTWGCGRS